MDFIYEYFIKPMYEKTGYNIVNTLTYSIIAIISLLIFYTMIKLKGKKIDKFFFITLIPYVLFGATKRVITDAVDKGILHGGIYNFYTYNPMNISPGIYVITALIFLSIYAIEVVLRQRGLAFILGLLLFLFHIVILFPALSHIDYGMPPLACAVISFIILLIVLKNGPYAFAISSQLLDGCATFYAVEYLGYGEQHVLPNLIGQTIGFWAFPIIKFIVALALILLLEKEKSIDENLKWLIISVVMIVGLAPGLRDTLRIMAMA